MKAILIDAEILKLLNKYNSLELFELAKIYYERENYDSCEVVLHSIFESEARTNYAEAINLLIKGKDEGKLNNYSDSKFVKALKCGSSMSIIECGMKLGEAYREGLLGLPKDPDLACKYYVEVMEAHSNKTYTGITAFKNFGDAYSEIVKLGTQLNNKSLDKVKNIVNIEK